MKWPGSTWIFYLKIIRQKTYFKILKTTSCDDFFITNDNGSSQNKITLASSLPGFHKMILTELKTTFQKVQTNEVIPENYKNFELDKVQNWYQNHNRISW